MKLAILCEGHFSNLLSKQYLQLQDIWEIFQNVLFSSCFGRKGLLGVFAFNSCQASVVYNERNWKISRPTVQGNKRNWFEIIIYSRVYCYLNNVKTSSNLEIFLFRANDALLVTVIISCFFTIYLIVLNDFDELVIITINAVHVYMYVNKTDIQHVQM